VITPSGNDIGPFKAVEQGALSKLVQVKKKEAAEVKDAEAEKKADAKALAEGLNWMTGHYTLISAWALALGAMTSGFVASMMQHSGGYTEVDAYRTMCFGYAVFGSLMLCLYCLLSKEIEPQEAFVQKSVFGLYHPESYRTVIKLSALFTMDSFAGGFVMQTFITYWFHVRFNMDEQYLGTLLMGANFLAGLSALAAAPMGVKYGEIETMVFTHFPSNVLLIAVVFMPNVFWACVMLLLRFSISQMDVPARDAYVNRVVQENERDAAKGITNLIRSLGVSFSPLVVAWLIRDEHSFWFSSPFIVAGVVKCLYDVLVWFIFKGYCCVPDTVKADPASNASGARSASASVAVAVAAGRNAKPNSALYDALPQSDEPPADDAMKFVEGYAPQSPSLGQKPDTGPNGK